MNMDVYGKIKIAEKLWDLANLVTGFAVAQSIATTFTVAKGDLKTLKDAGPHLGAIIATLIFTTFYIIAILWCRKNGSSRDSTDNSSLWHAATVGRVFAVILFTLVILVTFGGHWYDESKAKNAQTQASVTATNADVK